MLAHETTFADFFTETKKPSAGFCKVIEIALRTGAIIRMTDHNEPVTVGGDTYVPESSFTASAMRTALGGSVDNLTVEGITSTTVTEDDLIRGLFDDAEVRLGMVCWTNTAAGVVWRFRGFIGDIEADGTSYKVEIRKLSDFLQRAFGRAYMADCDVREFGDTRCGLDLVALGFVFTGETVTVLGASNRVFTISETQADGYFSFGKVEWTSGNNTGWSAEIVGHATDIVSLIESPPYAVEVGDVITLTRGCPRTWDFCKDEVDNILNHRGFGARKGDELWHMPPEEILAEVGGVDK